MRVVFLHALRRTVIAGITLSGACVPSYVPGGDAPLSGASQGGNAAGTAGRGSGGATGGAGVAAGVGGVCEDCAGEAGVSGTGVGGATGGAGAGGAAGDGCEGAGCDGGPGPCGPGPDYPCDNEGVCVENGAGFTCHCPEGFMGERCETEDPCVPNPCQHAGQCEREPFRCDCRPPYTGELCDSSPACRNEECDDFWLGTISGDGADETPLRFEVRDGGLAMIWFAWSSRMCGSYQIMTSLWTIPVGIVNSSINSTRQSDFNAGVAYTLLGDFESASSASGTLTLDISFGGCTALLTLNWTASRTLCGDGRIDWPETCDQGKSESSATCRSICQLPAFREDLEEPNDDGTPAVAEDDFSSTQTNGPFSENTLIFGTLLPAGDEDVFEVKNPSPVKRRVTLETHGPSMGSCGIDTEIIVHSTSGGTQATTDNGGISTCAALSYDIPANETVFVRVSEGDDDDFIPGYHLAIRFPE